MKLALLALILSTTLTACERRTDSTHSNPPSPAITTSPVIPIIQSSLSDPQAFQNLDFAKIVQASSGKHIIPIDPALLADNELLNMLDEVMHTTLARFNQDNSPTSSEKRINEVSKHFEDALRAGINASEGFLCTRPLTLAGKIQRSGYPDLCIVHQETGMITYLDPKLVSSKSLASSLRTFYFTPKSNTGKIREDAHHLLIGIEHNAATSNWKFTNWHLVDLSQLKIRLKIEFQASNKDLYQNKLLLPHTKSAYTHGKTY